MFKDFEVGRRGSGGVEGNNYGRGGSSRSMDVERYLGFIIVIGGFGSREFRVGVSISVESVVNGFGEDFSGDISIDDGNVGFGESGFIKSFYVVNGDGVVFVGVERVIEILLESKGMGKVEGDGRRSSLGRDGFCFNDRDNEFIEFVLVELRWGKNGSEDVEEVFFVNV